MKTVILSFVVCGNFLVHSLVGQEPNSNPQAADDTASTPFETPVDILPLTNDDDPDGDPLTIQGIERPPSSGAAEIEGSTIIYTPGDGFSGIDSFDYEVADDKGGRDIATITVTVGDGTGGPGGPGSPSPPRDNEVNDDNPSSNLVGGVEYNRGLANYYYLYMNFLGESELAHANYFLYSGIAEYASLSAQGLRGEALFWLYYGYSLYYYYLHLDLGDAASANGYLYFCQGYAYYYYYAWSGDQNGANAYWRSFIELSNAAFGS